MKCLRCGYERGSADVAPAWQCPSCKVAYVKAAAAVAPRAEPLPRKIAPPAEPIPPSEAASRRERAQEDRENIDAGVQEWLVARGQKILIYSIILNFVLRALDRAQVFPDLVMLGLSLLLAAWSLLGVVRICSGLQRSQGQKILFMVLTFFPLINLVVLVYLSVKATRLLREAGWSVGLLGARQ
jgi:hypothetical protein